MNDINEGVLGVPSLEILQGLDIGLVILDHNAVVTWTNESFVKLLDLTVEDIVDTPLSSISEENIKNELNLENLNQEKEITVGFYTREKKVKKLTLKVKSFVLPKGSVYVLQVCPVIRKNDHYKKIIENSDDIMFTSDYMGNLNFTNQRGEEITEFSKEELIGKNYLEFVHESDLERIRSVIMNHFLSKKDVLELEFLFQSKTGKKIRLFQKMNTLWDDNHERIVGYASVARDVTEKYKLQIEKEESEQKLQSIFEGVKLPIFIVDEEDFTIVECNRHAQQFVTLERQGDVTFEELFNLSKEELLTKTTGISDLSGNVSDVVMTNERGNRFDMKLNFSRVSVRNRSCFVVLCTDLTAINFLNDQNRRFKSALQNAPFSILIQDEVNGIFVDVNESACVLFGYSRGELLSLTFAELFDNFKPLESIFSITQSEMKNTDNYTVDLIAAKKDGDKVPVRMSLNQEYFGDKKYITYSIEDITKEMENEHRLITQNQKLRIIQTLQNDYISSIEYESSFDSFLASIILFTKSLWGGMYMIGGTEKNRTLQTLSFNDNSKNLLASNVNEYLTDPKFRLRVDNDLFGWSVSTGEVGITDDFCKDERNRKMFCDKIKSCLVVPVKVDNEVKGIIVLGNKKEAFNYHDILNLEDFSAVFSVMIQSLIQFEEKTSATRSLKEKDLLLKEIHHRVKNNMQVISSMLNLTFSKFGDEVTKRLEDSTNRINTMALVHEELYQSKNLKNINAKKFIRDISQYLKGIYESNVPVTLELDIESIEIDIDKAIPVGLILNEILSNSFKYAMKGNENPVFSISFHENDEGLQLVLADNGNVAQDVSDLKRKNSLGTKLVDTLVRQLKGDKIVEVKGGVEYTINFS